MKVSALPSAAAGVEPPPPEAGLLSSLLLPQAAAVTASKPVQPNTANRCVRMFSAPLQGFGSLLRPSNLEDGQPAARRSCVETATRQRKPTSQPWLVRVGPSQRGMHAHQARQLESGMQREAVGTALERRPGDALDALQAVVQAGAMEEQRLGGELGVAPVVEVSLERLDQRFLALEREQLGQPGMDQLGRVGRLGGAREQPVGAEL